MKKEIPEIEKRLEVEPVKYSPEELLYRSQIIKEAQKAYDQRQLPFTELDDMTYDFWYITNLKARNGYIQPKVNPEDVRTVSGTTREKTNAILSAILNYNLEVDIEAYDEDDMPAKELGDTMEDMVKKSRKIELPTYEVKRPLIYDELLTQGTCFVRDQYIEYSVMKKNIAENLDMSDLSKIKWTESLQKVHKLCNTNLLCGLNVYLGNIREFYLDLQPFIIIRNEITRAEANAKYGKWERWKNVPYKITNSAPTSNTVNTTYNLWSMVEVGLDMVEELEYFNVWTNSYQIMLNGEMMLPINCEGNKYSGFPLEYLTGQITYPIAKGDVEPISRFFAYSRSVPAKTKVPQALMDEMMKAVILKTRKSYNPPIANNTGQTLSKKVFWPSNITNNLDGTKIQEIGNNQGVTNPEMQALQFVKGIIDESSVSPIFQGNSIQGSQTKGEIDTLQKQSMMKLGMAILGVVNLEIRLGWLRLFHILRYWTEPIDNGTEEVKKGIKQIKKYRTESMESTFDEGERGQRVVEFTDMENLPASEQVEAEEDLVGSRKQIKIRKIYLNVEDLKSIKYRWFINVVPTEKDTSNLKSVVFMDNVTKGFQLFGPQSFNLEYLKKQFAINNDMNPEKVLAQAPQVQPGLPPTETDNTLASQILPKQSPAPSLNTLAA